MKRANTGDTVLTAKPEDGRCEDAQQSVDDEVVVRTEESKRQKNDSGYLQKVNSTKTSGVALSAKPE